MPDRGTISASRRAQAGFSLLEMLIAVGILSAAAYVALDTVESDRGQMRFDLTETRLKMIRRAIVGDPDLAVNGGPVVSGFAADVGRLPDCLEELVTRMPDCEDMGGEEIPVYDELVPGLNVGWRGPYLTAGPEGMSDAWGNVDDTDGSLDPDPNFGWQVDNPPEPPPDPPILITVVSLARDRKPDPVPDPEPVPGSFDDDQAMVPIVEEDFRVSLAPASIAVEITGRRGVEDPSLDQPITGRYCLALLDIDPNIDPSDPIDWRLIPADTDGDDTPDGATEITIAEDVQTATDTLTFSASPDPKVTHGPRPLLIYDADDAEVDASDCSPENTKELLVENAVLRRFNILLAARTPPAATFRITVEIPEPAP